MADKATFTHKFFGWLEAEAKHHVNPDGSRGGIVALSASIAPGISLGLTVQVGHWASIGYGASIGDGASIGPRASIGYGEWSISCGPQGSRNAMLTAVQKPHGLRWWVGCKCSISTADLLRFVDETHGDRAAADDYRHVIAFVETHPGRIRAINAACEKGE
jgi:hypothetical protein